MTIDLVKKISPMELMQAKTKQISKKWPFKTMEIGEAIEVSDGFNGKTAHFIAVYARSFNNSSKKEFEIYPITKVDGTKVVQVLRTK